ncbi:MAG: nucleoside-diphosphate kinase [Solirubrobacterales bacterium]
MAEDGAFPASEDSRHPKTVITQSVMADGINTAMNAVQAGGFETAVDPGEGKSGRSQLIGRDDAVLACRKTSNEGVGPRFVAFLPHIRKKGDKDTDLAPHRQGFTTLVRLRTFVAGFGVARPEANPFLYGPAPMATERTLILVKPDAFERRLTGEVIARFERKGLHLVALKLMQADEELANAHYAEHTDKPFFGELVDFITSGDLVALVLEGPNAVKAARQVIGATDPVEADAGSLRGEFGTEVTFNLVHGSDSQESAEREIGIWFPEL